MNSRLIALAVALGFAVPHSADASPWTLPEDTLVLSTGFDVQFAGDEFLNTGTRQAYPLGGQFFSTSLGFGVRFGLSDRVELSARTSVSYLSHEAGEAYFGPSPDEAGSLEEIRGGILSFDRQVAGLGDIWLHLRYRMTPRQRFVATLEFHVKAPTGYQTTTGPTSERDEPLETESGNVIIDDVGLGDGQLDVGAQLLFGYAAAAGWFLRTEGGVRARFFGPGHQALAALKFGGRVMDAWVPYVATDFTYTFTDGEVVGQVWTTDVPETDPIDFSIDDVVTRDQTFDRSVLRVSIGSIVTLADQEIDISYSFIPWGENVAQLHILAIGTQFVL